MAFISRMALRSKLAEVPYRMSRPLLRALEPEAAHRLTIKALGSGLLPAPRPGEAEPARGVRIWGHTLSNPVRRVQCARFCSSGCCS